MLKKELGQYFTTEKTLQDKVLELIKNDPQIILEPSFGHGHLLIPIIQKYDILYHCYEIDKDLVPIIPVTDKIQIFYTDFLTAQINCKYQTIIGNPPYVKTSKGNLYLSFIEKCFDVLDDKGELIFIIPSDFLKITSASRIITRMTQAGTFTDFYFPHNERLFQDACIDIMIFRFQKCLQSNLCQVNGLTKCINLINGIMTFTDTSSRSIILKDLFYVFVGMVSGKESVLKHEEFGNINILNDKDTIERYIFIEEFPTGNSLLDSYLESNKDILMGRKIRKFNSQNWFQFGAPRNKKNIEEHLHEPCIYIRNMTRKKKVAFRETTKYFGGSLIGLIPKYRQLYDYLDSIVTYFNSPLFKENYLYSGRFKIGHKQVESVLIPINKLYRQEIFYR